MCLDELVLIMHTLHLPAKFRPQAPNSDPCYRLRGNRRPAEARRDGECREPPNLGRGGWAEAGGTSVGRAAADGRPAVGRRRSAREAPRPFVLPVCDSVSAIFSFSERNICQIRPPCENKGVEAVKYTKVVHFSELNDGMDGWQPLK